MLGSKSFYISYIFFKPRVVGNVVGRTLGDVGKAQKNITSQTIKDTQKNIIRARNINV
jgi:hypothetical protein